VLKIDHFRALVELQPKIDSITLMYHVLYDFLLEKKKNIQPIQRDVQIF
jgi:hypothetical protein